MISSISSATISPLLSSSSTSSSSLMGSSSYSIPNIQIGLYPMILNISSSSLSGLKSSVPTAPSPPLLDETAFQIAVATSSRPNPLFKDTFTVKYLSPSPAYLEVTRLASLSVLDLFTYQEVIVLLTLSQNYLVCVNLKLFAASLPPKVLLNNLLLVFITEPSPLRIQPIFIGSMF